MDSTARFLLGGALGAALGFLISQKNLEKVLKGVRPAGAPAWPADASTRPAPQTQPAPRAPQVTPTPTTVDAAPEAPVAHEPAWRIAPAPPLAPAPPAERTPTLVAPVPSITVAPPVAPAPEWEPEVIVTREFLEEPVPGSGWGSKATLSVSEDGLKELQDMVPLVSDVVLPYAGPEIATEARASRPTLVWPEPVSEAAIEDLPPEAEPVIEEAMEPAVELLVEPVIEAPEELMIVGFPDDVVVEQLEEEVVETKELVAEIKGPGTEDIEALVETTEFPQTELEEPVDEELAAEGRISPPPEPEIVVVVDRGDAVPTGMEALVGTASVESAPVELPVVEELVELPVEELVVEELSAEEAPVEELSVEETPMAEAVPAVSEAAAAVIGEPIVDIARVDDLKSRIEETRRRIRRELEQPFDTEEEVQEREPDWTVLPAVPVAGAPADVAPVFAEPEAPAAAEPEPRVVEVIFPDEPEEPVDYESMKSRIEVTRSRLKAKAFDAMMTGESALLGRDAEGSDRNRSALPSVDTEIDDTIETSLREEEE